MHDAAHTKFKCTIIHAPHTPEHTRTVCHVVGLALFTVPSMLGVSAGDGNCFYRALLAGMVEGLCLDPQPAYIAALCKAFMSQQSAVASCPVIDHQSKALALQGHKFLQVPMWCQCLMLLV